MKLKKIWKQHRFSIIGFAIGVFGGYMYWYHVGCLSGTCPLKQLWYYDGLIGGLFGLFIADLIHSIINKRKKQKENYEND